MFMYTAKGNKYYGIEKKQPMSYIRFLHAAPRVKPVNIYANDVLLVSDLGYKDFSEYIPVMPGVYDAKVVTADENERVIIKTKLEVVDDTATTIAAVGTPDYIALQLVPEMYIKNLPLKNTDDAFIRVVHFSPDTVPVDVKLSDGTVLFENIAYKTRSDYLSVKAGSYDIDVFPTGNPNAALSLKDVNLMPGMIYSVYAVGLSKGKPTLETVTSIDGDY